MNPNSFEVLGKLEEKYDEVSVNDKFRKREFVVEIQDGQYSQYAKFQLTQDRCGALDHYEVGDSIKVSFGLQGRPYANKNTGEMVYYTNLNAWKIQRGDASPNQPPPPQPDEYIPPTDDDLPF